MESTCASLSYSSEAGSITKWRIENSWGTKLGFKGFYSMNDNWFDEHVYTAVVHKKHLPENLAQALNSDPTFLMPWELPY